MNKRTVRFFSFLLALTMVAGMLPVSVRAVETGESDLLSCTAQEQVMELPEIVTHGWSAALFAGGAEITLAEGNHVRWIDRLANIPDYAAEFYSWLTENSDADGTEDALIDVVTGEDLSGIYAHTVVTYSETVPFTVAEGADNEAILAAGSAAANAVISENMSRTGAWISAVMQAFDRDHPEVFWLSGSHRIRMPSSRITMNYDGSSWVAVFEQKICMELSSSGYDIRAEEYQDAAAVQRAVLERDNAVSGILATVTGSSRQEKIREINRWLTENNCYNTSSDLSNLSKNCRNSYGALVGSVGVQGPVCEGYARAFMVLCGALDIPCVLVDGEANNGSRTEGHMWNYVQMEDGKWYAVDVTWNDPSVAGVSGAVSGLESESYLLVGGDTVIDGMAFLQSHPVSNTVADGGTAFLNGPVLAGEKYVSSSAERPSEMRTISILGDSISTYTNVSSGTAADSTNSTIRNGSVYYSPGKLGVFREDTWWQQAADVLGLEVLVNNSWSGSCILSTRSGTVGAYADRCEQLHDDTGDNAGEEPDMIVVFLGTNDFSYYQSSLGTADGIDYDTLITQTETGFSYSKPATACEAYAVMLHKMTQRYQNAVIYCMTLLPRRDPDYEDNYADVGQPSDFNDSLEQIAQRFGCVTVDLENCGIGKDANVFDTYIGDRRVHPNAEGMDKITNALVSAVSGTDVEIHDVSFNLSNVTVQGNTSHALLRGTSYTATLTPEISGAQLEISVTMGGVDITDSCYANGKVTISSVTGDIEITASAVVPVGDPQMYRWEFDGTALNSVTTSGNVENALSMLGGTITNGMMNGVYYQLAHTVHLVHDRSWVVEWRAQGDWSGMIFSAKENSSAEGNEYLFKTTTDTGLIAFGQRINDAYHNYGAALTDYGIDPDGLHTYRLENRIAPDESNMVYLSVDGTELGAMNHYYIAGSNDQNQTVDWVSGKDFTFAYIGASNHALNNCQLEYIQVWEKTHIHNYEAVVTAPSCTEQGYTTYTCACGESYVDDYTDAVGHTAVTDAAVAPTYTQNGLSEGRHCSVCDAVLIAQQSIPAARDGSRLPDGYILLEYLDSLDGAYIDTGISAGTEDRIILYAAALSSSAHSLMGSGLTSLTDDRVQAHYNSDGYTLRFYGEMSRGINASLTEMVSFVFDMQNCVGYINGEIVLEQPKEVLPMDCSLYLFSKNLSGTSDSEYTNDTRIYAYKHYRNGELLRDMVPCMRESDEEYGMYDLTEGKFYTNAGEGSLFFDELNLTGSGGIVMNMETGEIYYGKNIQWKHGMASTTKVMTCILAIENLELDSRTLAAVKEDLIGGTTMGLTEGESLTVLNALYGLMLPSGNDAAQLLARTVAGDYNSFVDMMNEKAEELGMTDTHYTDASGKADSDSHYTTVYDMTKLMRYAMESEVFRMLISTKAYQIEADGLGGRAHSLTNTNQLLETYEGCLGGKTGTTVGSGAHLIAAAERHGTTIVAMILGSDKENRFTDVEKLLDYGFQCAPAHIYEPTVTDPTCTERGYTTHTCTCGDSYVDSYVEATGHDFGPWEVKTAATCTAKGTEQRECGTCGATETREVDMAEHSYEAVVTAPTCTERGYTTHTCGCGESYVDSYVNATGHTFGAWEVKTAATCTAVGEERRECENCEHFESREIEQIAHVYESVVTAPTEDERGYTTHTCTACGHTYVDSYVDPMGHTHSYTSTVTDPTCTERGYTTHICGCGESYVDSYVNATGHTFGAWEVKTAATCTAVGEERRECADCEHFESREIEKTAHVYESVVTAPTEDERGYTTHTCTACGHSYVDSYVDPMGHTHSYESDVTAPTCTERGYTTHICSCGESYVDSYVNATGHTFGAWEVKTAATCTAVGEERRECENCEHFESREIEKIAHVYESVVTAPTEDERGYTTHTCTACGHSYVDSYVDPMGHTHSYTSTVTAPTCTERGYTTHTCGCGESYVDSYVNAMGHTFGAWEVKTAATCTDVGEERRECENCEHFESREIEKIAHVYESVVTAPTETAQGYTTHTCAVCGHSYVDAYVDPAGHSYEAVVTAPICTERGYTTHTCTDCGERYVDSYVDATGHSFGGWEMVDGFVHSRGCGACDARETELHSWSAGEVSPDGLVTTTDCTVCGHSKRENAGIVGAWETDIVFPAADMGVQAADTVFRAKLTFGEDGTVTAEWEAVELSAIREYFHTMFVNAYYACAYGAGITSFEEVESFCMESTGMGVSEYMYAFLDSFDMYALFTPEDADGSYRVDQGGSAVYTDLPIMECASDPEIANEFRVDGETMELKADSYGKPEYTFVCTRCEE